MLGIIFAIFNKRLEAQLRISGMEWSGRTLEAKNVSSLFGPFSGRVWGKQARHVPKSFTISPRPKANSQKVAAAGRLRVLSGRGPSEGAWARDGVQKRSLCTNSFAFRRILSFGPDKRRMRQQRDVGINKRGASMLCDCVGLKLSDCLPVWAPKEKVKKQSQQQQGKTSRLVGCVGDSQR